MVLSGFFTKNSLQLIKQLIVNAFLSLGSNLTSFQFVWTPRYSQLGWILGVLVTHSILAVFIVFSNIVVLAAFFKNSKLRTTTNLVIISMATADLLVGCVVIPIWLYVADLDSMIGPPFEKWHMKLVEAYTYIDQALGLNSVFQLVLLHGLRSYSIAFPLRHRQMNKSKYLYWLACADRCVYIF